MQQRERIVSQMKILNDNFAGSQFTFTLVGIDWTYNKIWNSRAEWGKQLRRGGYDTLNVYTERGNAGFCRLPLDVKKGSDEFNMDGCAVGTNFFVGGPSHHYDKGKVIVHEVGHWQGLLHTITGCKGDSRYHDDIWWYKRRQKQCSLRHDQVHLPWPKWPRASTQPYGRPHQVSLKPPDITVKGTR